MQLASCVSSHWRAGVTQAPFVQTFPPVQVWPQAPQFWALSLRFWQVPAQSVSPEGQVQAPFEQTFPLAHAFPQAPQFCASLARLLHCSLQQCVPAEQETPHVPQCWSVDRPMHTPPQHPFPVAQPNSTRHSASSCLRSCTQAWPYTPCGQGACWALLMQLASWASSQVCASAEVAAVNAARSPAAAAWEAIIRQSQCQRLQKFRELIACPPRRPIRRIPES